MARTKTYVKTLWILLVVNLIIAFIRSTVMNVFVKNQLANDIAKLINALSVIIIIVLIYTIYCSEQKSGNKNQSDK
jgi:hypothetical protein